MYVEVRGNSPEDLDRALRQFSRKVKRADLMNEIRKRQYYLSKSQKRAVKDKESFKRSIRESRRSQKTIKEDW
jgi:ribosomal protein S21